MTPLFRIAFFLLAFSHGASADIYCDAEVLQWQEDCAVFFDAAECKVDDICALPQASEIPESAVVEIPSGTPEGYSEQIYVIP